MKLNGSFNYIDCYDVQYIVEWITVNGILDITVETRQPFVWNQPRTGYISNNKLFVNGMITVQRQMIRLSDNVVVASGHTNNLGYIYVSSIKSPDIFKHLCNYNISDNISSLVTSSPVWDTIDGQTEWADLDGDGDVITPTSLNLEWINVW